ncbi:MAG: DUF1588 domain-containing protein [Polyangiaceae bacterium]|nr:DUF1588 domain-containing protein [Polyangiaceae bacterium]
MAGHTLGVSEQQWIYRFAGMAALFAGSLGCSAKLPGDDLPRKSQPEAAAGGSAAAKPTGTGGATSSGVGGAPAPGTTSALPNDPAFACSSAARGTVPARIWRLTQTQLERTVAALVLGRDAAAKGDNSPVAVGSVFGAPNASDRFSTNSDSYGMTDFEFTQLWNVSDSVAASLLQAWGKDSQSCVSASVDGACVKSVIASAGEILFRRPLSTEEATAYESISTNNAAALGATRALKLVLRAMFMAPQSIFRAELGEAAMEPTVSRLDSFEVASALAYTLTDAPPDAALWEQARAGKLTTPIEVAGAASQLISQLETKPAYARFIAEYFQFEKAAIVPKDAKEVPFHKPDALIDDTRAWVREVSTRSLGAGFLNQLLTFGQVVANDVSRENYGISSVIGAKATLLPAPAGERAGMLTQPSFLTAYSAMAETKPVQRGKFVASSLLCQEVPPLPIDVVPPLPDLGAAATMRDKLQVHSARPDCAACHTMMDPIGLGMEDFDHVGRFRTMEQGKPVNASGELKGTGMGDGTFNGAVQLGSRLAVSSVVEGCFVRHSFRYWMGHLEGEGDGCSLSAVLNKYQEGGDYRAALVELFSSKSFLERISPAQP